jgi:hypothetical protein
MIEDLLSEITERGWHVYTLRDCADSRLFRWECTLRNPLARLVTYGQGHTCELALSQALDGIDRAEPFVLPTFTVHKTAPAVDLREILARCAPVVQIERRKL